MKSRQLAVAVLLLVTVAAVQAQDAPLERSKLSDLPVREVTVFKDGHAFVRREGSLEVDDAGEIHLDELPAPVLGTFWPYVSGNDYTLRAASARQATITQRRVALNLAELLESNVGSPVRIRETDDTEYEATVLAVPRTEPSGPAEGTRGDVILLKTASGIRVVPLGSLHDVTFLDDVTPSTQIRQSLKLLTLHLAKTGNAGSGTTTAGVVFLQQGLRWIPQYRIDLSDDGTARVTLQATLINELVDLDDATVKLVIGVPRFQFARQTDPIALQQTLAQLNAADGRREGESRRNLLMLQTNSGGFGLAETSIPEVAQPASPIGEKAEDLFTLTIDHVSLKKDARMILPIGSWSVTAESIYEVSLPVQPPIELTQQMNSDYQEQLARYLSQPVIRHRLELKNTSDTPFTNAPALFFRKGQVLSQAMLTYTPPGGTTRVDLGHSVDITLRHEEIEQERTLAALRYNDRDVARIDLKGTLRLESYYEDPVKIEVTAYVLGEVTSTDPAAEVARLSPRGAAEFARPHWWSSISWPSWWAALNPLTRMEWQFTLERGEPQPVEYEWQYLWRD